MPNIQTSMIDFKGNGDQVPGYLARPESGENLPAVVVIQEWWGLNAHIKDVVDRFAQAGFVALAPDLYRGAVAKEPDEARKLAMELDHPQAIVDIQGAVNYLISQPDVLPQKAGVVGFCMGGGLSLLMSTEGKDIGAVVVFYGGRGQVDDDQASRVSAPILGHFGEEDHGIPIDLVRANEAKIKEHNKTIEFHIYPDAPHAFFNNERASYREEASKLAWERTLDWFHKYLV